MQKPLLECSCKMQYDREHKTGLCELYGFLLFEQYTIFLE